MAPPELIRALLSQATSSGSRSTALQPLGWLTCILTSGLVLAAVQNVIQWALILLAVLLMLSVCIFLVSYVYFAFKNPDALRSEKYTLSKMAIEKNLIGDNMAGLLEVEDFGELPKAQALPSKNGGVN